MNSELALIVGGAGVLGVNIAHKLALKGYIPLLLDKDLESLNRALQKLKQDSSFCLIKQTNATNLNELNQAVIEFSYKFGIPKILINVVGYSPKHNKSKPSLLDISEEEWKNVIDINLTSAFNCVKATIPLMIKNGGGKIVFISSTAGVSGSLTAGAHYCSAKAGLIGLTKAMAYEFASQNILVNAIAPGKFVVNPNLEDNSLEINTYISHIPLKRLANVDEIAEAVIFMVSEQNTYMTGKTLVVDGGRLVG